MKPRRAGDRAFGGPPGLHARSVAAGAVVVAQDDPTHGERDERQAHVESTVGGAGGLVGDGGVSDVIEDLIEQQGVDEGDPGLRPVEHLTTEERAARGRAARAASPRSSHAAWGPPGDRRDPVEILEEQATTRVPELVPIRYGRMLVSPFTFYRGAAAVMASDLAGGPRTGLTVQLCGDAHLSNFGGFAAPDRRIVFSINDFDETLPGPFEWDVKRLVASFEIAGRDRGFDRQGAAAP